MGPRCADAEIRIAGRVGKIFRGVFRHPLDFEAQDIQLVHHRGHAGGNHPEILAAGQHTGHAEQRRKLPKGALPPEVIVAVVEEIFIQGAEALLLPGFEPGEGLAVPGCNPGMVPAFFARIFDKEFAPGVEAHGAHFVGAVRECRGEMAHQAALVTGGNLPNAEESEDMVDAVSVEIFVHLAQPLLPPGKAGLGHLVPVIGRETPVLAVGAEGIRRSPRLHVEVEELRRHPGVGAGAAHPDGKIPLDGYPVGMGIGHGLFELDVQAILDPAPEGDRSGVGGGIFLRFFPAETGILSPLGEVDRTFFVPEAAEHGIRQQPIVVRLYKCLIFRIFY